VLRNEDGMRIFFFDRCELMNLMAIIMNHIASTEIAR